jgi:hypothetical protein
MMEPERPQITIWWCIEFWTSKATRHAQTHMHPPPPHTHTHTHTHTEAYSIAIYNFYFKEIGLKGGCNIFFESNCQTIWRHIASGHCSHWHKHRNYHKSVFTLTYTRQSKVKWCLYSNVLIPKRHILCDTKMCVEQNLIAGHKFQRTSWKFFAVVYKLFLLYSHSRCQNK